MTLTKKDIIKLNTFYDNLTKYLNDWQSTNYFYYDAKHQAEICAELSINCDTLEESNRHYKDLDEDDRQSVKDMLGAKELSFKASKETPLYYVKFNYIKKI